MHHPTTMILVPFSRTSAKQGHHHFVTRVALLAQRLQPPPQPQLRHYQCTWTLQATADPARSHSRNGIVPTSRRRDAALKTTLRPISRSSRLFSTAAASSSSRDSESSVTETNDLERATSEKLRRVLRNVPFPVVVVSTTSPKDSSLRRGITVSSFTSISLQPVPLVAFCVKLPSRASMALHDSDKFIVQFLASDQIAHSVAFSSSVPPPPSNTVTTSPTTATTIRRAAVPKDQDIEDLIEEARRQILIDSGDGAAVANKEGGSTIPSPTTTTKTTATTESDPDPFEVLGYETDPESQLPMLRDTMGALRCRTHQVTVVGDHELWIGLVEKVLHGEIPNEREPLLYHDRSYRKVGRRINSK